MILIAPLILALILLLLLLYAPRRSNSLPAFPGPKPRWILGNLFDIPIYSPWIKFTQWSHLYDIFSLNALGNNIIVLNTPQSITDLFEKRGNIYSDRPTLTMGGELMGLDQTTGFCPYGNTWRQHRKLSKLALAPDVVQQYIPTQQDAARMLLRALIDNPLNFIPQLRLCSGRIVMSATYGLAVNSADDKYITETESALERINRALIPGTYLVDLIPALKHLPPWMPFTSFLQEAATARAQVIDVVTRPFDHVKRDIAAGKAPHSFTADLLTALDSDPEAQSPHARLQKEETIKWAAGSMYGAGGETTFAALLTFILAMTLHPSIQTRAQAEIDATLHGDARLPTLHDVEHMPYVSALVKEVLRWHVVLPLGIARKATEEDVYNGCKIPAGSTIIPNVWAIAMSPSPAPGCAPPSTFSPDRFLACPAPVDPYTYSFGFGRRICPGRHLATNSLILIISSLLATFTFSPSPDEAKAGDGDGDGNGEAMFTKGLVSYPEPFKCAIEVRSEKIREVVFAGGE